MTWDGGRNVRELTEWHFQRHGDAVEAVDRDRFFTALDFADEFPAQPRMVAEPFLAQPPLLAQRPQMLSEVLSDMFDRTF